MRHIIIIFIGVLILSCLKSFGQKTDNKLPEPLVKILNDTIKGETITSFKQVPQNLYSYMDTMFRTKDYPFRDNQKNLCADCGTYIAFLLIKENYVFIGYWTMGNSTHDYLDVFDLTNKQVILTKYDILEPERGTMNHVEDIQSLIEFSTGNWFKKIQTIKM